MTIILDSGPLFRVSMKHVSLPNRACDEWLGRMLVQGRHIAVPEIADYEVRRFLLKGDRHAGIATLNALVGSTNYIPITTPAILKAAELWADTRKKGNSTKQDLGLDADVILAAQTLLLDAAIEDEVIVASENVKHLELFVNAKNWQDIK